MDSMDLHGRDGLVRVQDIGNTQVQDMGNTSAAEAVDWKYAVAYEDPNEPKI